MKSFGELYVSTCSSLSVPVNKGIVAVIEDEHESHELNLRGSGSLQPQLKKLKLSDEDMHPLCSVLSSNSTIFYLNLGFNALSDASMSFIAPVIESNTTLLSLDLSGNDFEETGAHLLCEALETNNTLRELNLRGNKIGEKGNLRLAEVLVNNSSLSVLDVSSTDQTTACVIAYASVLQTNRTITTFSIDRPLEFSKQEEGTIHMASMLEKNHVLKHLSLQFFQMQDFGLSRICHSLCANKTLQTLDLSNNQITRHGCVSIAEMLQHNNTLQKLLLDRNTIEDEGAITLSHALLASSLCGLGVSFNKIFSEGMKAIAELIHVKEKLSFVTIWGNPGICGPHVDFEACKAVAKAIDRSDSVNGFEHIDVQGYVVDGNTLLARVV
eukprot:m.221499 g.221499  ORF g.221499 m.221499 type:complete len:383 (-) comp13841_c1_seq1:7164-8312(-)